MTSNLTLLCNFVEKYLGTIRFGNDQFAPILGYGDFVQRKYYAQQGLQTTSVVSNHNLFSVGHSVMRNMETQTSSTPICPHGSEASPTHACYGSKILSQLGLQQLAFKQRDVCLVYKSEQYVKDQLCSPCTEARVLKSRHLMHSLKKEGIEHQTSTPSTPEQKRHLSRTETELSLRAARNDCFRLLNILYSFWDDGNATAGYTQKRSIIIPT
ncbi:hypothetical protein Tco_0245911 [Tanacetum coccineum]